MGWEKMNLSGAMHGPSAHPGQQRGTQREARRAPGSSGAACTCHYSHPWGKHLVTLKAAFSQGCLLLPRDQESA